VDVSIFEKDVESLCISPLTPSQLTERLPYSRGGGRRPSPPAMCQGDTSCTHLKTNMPLRNNEKLMLMLDTVEAKVDFMLPRGKNISERYLVE
jgi:hypothetical protein